MTGEGRITVGIASRGRPEVLARCLRSLALLGDGLAETIVVDDGSDPPLEAPVRAMLGADAPVRLRFLRNERSRGPTAGRNAFARAAATEYVLSLDDDVVILSADAVRSAVEVMDADAEVAIVAFAQTDEAGRPWPEQAAPVDYRCYVPAFIGFAHLLRRSDFLAVGGYREQIDQNGEEKELALRLLDAGRRIVYLPDARIAHLAASAGRDMRRYLHQVVRNDVLSGLYNEPFPLVLASVPVRLRRYFPMRKGWKVDDPGGFGAILRRLAADLPGALRERRPVKWSTLRRWREMTRRPPEPYRGAGENDARKP